LGKQKQQPKKQLSNNKALVVSLTQLSLDLILLLLCYYLYITYWRQKLNYLFFVVTFVTLFVEIFFFEKTNEMFLFMWMAKRRIIKFWEDRETTCFLIT